ncbi:hypothetical protein ACFQO9_08445 [Chryseobacterium zhengzhouense]|uniref:Uncharacterized protein n=1 Tax=Chryseobacterium zhengzhouense TaxID=1636086 RepID=A0ABW2LZP8_9FLAO
MMKTSMLHILLMQQKGIRIKNTMHSENDMTNGLQNNSLRKAEDEFIIKVFF